MKRRDLLKGTATALAVVPLMSFADLHAKLPEVLPSARVDALVKLNKRKDPARFYIDNVPIYNVINLTASYTMGVDRSLVELSGLKCTTFNLSVYVESGDEVFQTIHHAYASNRVVQIVARLNYGVEPYDMARCMARIVEIQHIEELGATTLEVKFIEVDPDVYSAGGIV